MLADTLVLSQLYALPIWGQLHLCNYAAQIMCGLRNILAACCDLGWLPFDSLVQHHTLNLMYHHYTHADCVQLHPPFNLALIVLMEPDTPHIFVAFFGTQNPLDRGYFDHKLLLGGTAYLVHCLIALLIFHIICMNIYLICDIMFCMCMLLYVVLILYCMYVVI